MHITKVLFCCPKTIGLLIISESRFAGIDSSDIVSVRHDKKRQAVHVPRLSASFGKSARIIESQLTAPERQGIARSFPVAKVVRLAIICKAGHGPKGQKPEAQRTENEACIGPTAGF